MSVAVEITHVSALYGTQTVLHDVSLQIASGEVVVCIGPNGAGKSSLLRTIAGVLPMSHGQIMVYGQNVSTQTPAQRARTIAVVPQFIQMPAGFTVFDIVAMARYVHHAWYRSLSAHDHDIIWDAMQQAGVAEFAQKPATQLSGGEQQRVAFARAIAQQPQVLILDESTAHLDLRHQHAIVKTMQRLAHDGVTIIAAMHDINLAAATAQRLCLLDAGRLVTMGTPSAVLQTPYLDAVYHTPLHIVERPDSAVPFFHLAL